MRRPTLILLALSIAPFGCGAQWRTLESTEGGFRVFMPIHSERIDVSHTTEIGTVRFLGYGCESHEHFRWPWLDETPSEPYVRATSLDLRSLAPDVRIEADARALEYPELERLPAGPGRFKPFKAQACKGLETYVPGAWVDVRRRACVVGDYVYVLSMIGTKEEVTDARAERFFGSLEIVSQH